MVLSPPDLAAALERTRITTIFLTTALFNQIADVRPAAFRTVREVLVGGDAVDARAVRKVLSAGPPQRLLNGYGPTETTTFATWFDIQNVEPDATTVPIGYPISNTETYLLDANLEPVGLGIAGELYIGGDGVARGYWNRPSQTAERFVPHPGRSGARLYRTGDRARRRSDGAIEFLGRLDHQVKVRGFRIELGEIELALEQHEAVREALVVVRDGPGGKQVVAYARGQATEGSGREVRRWLEGRLPSYMVPAAVVFVEQWPLTSNGKVDRNALPAPDTSGAAGSYVGPATPLEELLIGIWMGLLPVARVGVHDNFFELGGHSLLATQVAARIQKQCGVELPVRAVFEAPTVAGLAQETQRRLSGTRGADRPIVRVPRDAPLPLSFAERRLWFLDQLRPGTSTYNVPVALRLRGRLDADALARALGALVQRHEGLRTRFVSRDGEPLRVVDAHAGFVLNGMRSRLPTPSIASGECSTG